MPSRYKLAIVVCLSALCCAPLLVIGKVYKWLNADGTVIFSDTPPAGQKAEEVNMSVLPANVIRIPKRQRQQLLRKSANPGSSTTSWSDARSGVRSYRRRWRRPARNWSRRATHWKTPRYPGRAIVAGWWVGITAAWRLNISSVLNVGKRRLSAWSSAFPNWNSSLICCSSTQVAIPPHCPAVLKLNQGKSSPS
jgi:hypothetical protein